MMTRRFGAAALAAVTALSLNTGVANAATSSQYDNWEEAGAAIELAGMFIQKGYGVVPDTDVAGQFAAGSIDAGSSASQAYWASQVGWGAVWAGIIGAVATVGYNEAVKAGLVKPIM